MDVDEILKQREEALRIRCPHCHQVYHDEEYICVSYWGDNGPYEITCEHCGKDFVVYEYVTREYETQPYPNEDS